jgi:hypothetical protein
MKKILFVLAVALFLSACNSDSGKNEATESVAHGNETAGLTLNNGAKWKADSITNHNVATLKTMTDNFRIKPFPTVGEYRLLGNDLTNGLNTMVQECKMTGPDHEAVHHWLEPVLNEMKELKNVSETANGRRIFKSLDKKIDSYHTYFE